MSILIQPAMPDLARFMPESGIGGPGMGYLALVAGLSIDLPSQFRQSSELASLLGTSGVSVFSKIHPLTRGFQMKISTFFDRK